MSLSNRLCKNGNMCDLHYALAMQCCQKIPSTAQVKKSLVLLQIHLLSISENSHKRRESHLLFVSVETASDSVMAGCFG